MMNFPSRLLKQGQVILPPPLQKVNSLKLSWQDLL